MERGSVPLVLRLEVSWDLGASSGRYCSENKMELLQNPEALVLCLERLPQAAVSLSSGPSCLQFCVVL